MDEPVDPIMWCAGFRCKAERHRYFSTKLQSCIAPLLLFIANHLSHRGNPHNAEFIVPLDAPSSDQHAERRAREMRPAHRPRLLPLSAGCGQPDSRELPKVVKLAQIVILGIDLCIYIEYNVVDLYLQSGSYKGFDRWANTNQRSFVAWFPVYQCGLLRILAMVAALAI